MDLNSKELKALELFNEFNTNVIPVESGNLSEAIPLEVARSLYKKGYVTIAAKLKEGFEAVLTIYGKKFCSEMKNNEEEKGADEMSEKELSNVEEVVESTPQDEVEYISLQEAADLFGCTYPNLYAHVTRGNLERLEVGGKKVVRKADVLELKSKKGTRKKRTKKESPAEPVQVQTEPTEEVASESTSEPEPKKEEVVAPVPCVLPPSISKITEVEVGSELILSGKVWVKEPKDEAYSTKDVDDITVTVVSRHPAGEGIWLICQPSGSKVYLAVFESEVLSGKYKIKATLQDKLASRNAEMEKELEKFRSALMKFVDARDKKLEAGKLFTKVDKDERPVIDRYVRTYGRESKEGKQDFLVSEMGYDTHLVRTPGQAITTYKEDEMLAWLRANGHEDCIKMVPDIDMWKNLKAAKKVPAEVIDSLEEMTVTDDRFSLTVKKSK